MLTACQDTYSTLPPSPAVVTVVGTEGRRGVAGAAADELLVIRVQDREGFPVSNALVRFQAAAGSGTVSPDTIRTTRAGEATTAWRFGGTAGSQRVTVTVDGLGAGPTFDALVSAAAPTSATIERGAQQTGVAGDVVAIAPAVVVRDSYGNPVPDVAVSFRVEAGGGVLEGDSVRTTALGIAQSPAWRLGRIMGRNTVTARFDAAGLRTHVLTFVATGIPGAATRFEAASPQQITAAVASEVQPTPSIRLLDQHGNPVAGVPVTFAASAMSTIRASATATTDTLGLAAVVGWRLGEQAQPYELLASTAGLPAVAFRALATPLAPSRLELVAGDGGQSALGTTVQPTPRVRITDVYRNPIASVGLLFEVTSGGGRVSEPYATTDSLGVAGPASWTLGGTIGAQTLRASVLTVGGIMPGVFRATGVAGTPVSVVATSDVAQSGVVGSPVPHSPGVAVRDIHGYPVPGVMVQFTPAAASGTVVNLTATTDSEGIARAGAWTLGTGVGLQQLTAHVAGLPVIAFSATAAPGSATRLTALTSTGFFATVGTVISPAPSVRVTDQYGNPVANANVVFQRIDLLGTGTTVAASANGTATMLDWRAGTTAGVTETLTATLPGQAAEVRFTVTTVAGAPTMLLLANGSAEEQAGIRGEAVTLRPAVVVVDLYRNPIAGAVVSWVPSAGTVVGSNADRTSTSNAQGLASVASWTLPAIAGRHTLTAVLIANPTIARTFAATAP